MRIRIFILTLILAGAGMLQAQLKRRAMLGAQLVPITEDLAQSEGLDPGTGLYVQSIVPGHTGEKLKLKEGDVLTSVNGHAVHSMPELFGQLNGLREGDLLTVEVLRKGKPKTLKAEATPRPLETSQSWEVIYDQFDYKDGHIRVIVQKPRGEGPFPVFFLIPGYNCASYDAIPDWHPYRKLLDGMVQKGYVTIRVEKPGMGDSDGSIHCESCDFDLEQESFESGYKHILGYDFIDKDNIFVFGHSLGGLQAPVLAEKYAPKGVMVYGTRHDPWMEYLTQMLRFQNPRLGIDPLQNEADMHLYYRLLYRQYILKETPEKLAAENPEYRRLLERDFQYDGADGIFGRHYDFWYDLQDLRLAETWSKVPSYVLSLCGEADFEVITTDSQEEIAAIVNRAHPGHGEFVFVEGTDHSMLKVGSMEDGVALKQDRAKFREVLFNGFNFGLIDTMDQWMQDKMDKQL